MLHSLRNLFFYSWEFLLSALGTTTLSVVLFSLLIPVLTFTLDLIPRWRTEYKSGATPKQIIKKSLFSLRTVLRVVGVYLLTWIVLLGWGLSTTAYRDHLALLRRIRELKAE